MFLRILSSSTNPIYSHLNDSSKTVIQVLHDSLIMPLSLHDGHLKVFLDILTFYNKFILKWNQNVLDGDLIETQSIYAMDLYTSRLLKELDSIMRMNLNESSPFRIQVHIFMSNQNNLF